MTMKPHRLTTADGRIAALTTLAEALEKSLQQNFTGDVFTRYRQCLDDIAKETGGRKSRNEVPSWKDKIITALKQGRINPIEVQNRLGDGIAAELFKAAGVTSDRAEQIVVYIPDNGR